MELINQRYETIRELGSGGFGTVYLARDTQLDILVALKRYDLKKMQGKFGSEEKALKYSVVNEIRRAIRLNHPNIIRYYDAFSISMASAFGQESYQVGVMEYLPDGDLQEYVARHGADSPAGRAVFSQIVAGLEYLHQQGIIHRDIKPGNILFLGDTPKILDFGISKEAQTDAASSASLLLHTPQYISPEQIAPENFGINGQIQPNLDFWCFGVMWYFLCTGQYPFGTLDENASDTSREQIRTNVLRADPALLDWQRVPATYRTALQACLVRHAKDRVQTAADLRHLLEHPGSKPPPNHREPDHTVVSGAAPKLAAKPAPSAKPTSVHKQAAAKKQGDKRRLLLLPLLLLLFLGAWWLWPDNSIHEDRQPSDDTLISDTTTPAQKQETDPFAANMVRVTGGTFTMGCQDGRDTDCYDREKPAHEVTLSSFSLSKYEVTQAQWRAVMGNNSSYNKNCDQCPVEQVSWNDIQDFLRKLNTQTGQNYRLPTEAEWEFAARGGNSSQSYLYSGSNDISEVAWYGIISGRKTHTVGNKKPNELGLYDMSGNVWEWCSDWYGDYSSSAQTNPKGPLSGTTNRVGRGGSWNSYTPRCRVANRLHWSPTNVSNLVGFRLARS